MGRRSWLIEHRLVCWQPAGADARPRCSASPVGKTDCYNSRVASKAAYAADLEECGGALFSCF